MDKKPLIGVSIVAVVLLVLGSVTNVVGYQSVKPTAIKDSPLFTIRTKNANNEENPGVLQSTYLGKENNLKFLIPSSINERVSIRKVINRLQGMDDASYATFLKNVLLWLSTQEKYKDVNVPQLIFTLQQIKQNPRAFERYFAMNYDESTKKGSFTVHPWIPGCILGSIVIILIIILIILLSGPTTP